MSTTTKLKFNLLHEPWLPVVDLHGVTRDVSLTELISDADQLGGITHEDPLVVIAAYRFVLAFLHRALEGPEETEEVAEWFEDGFPSDKIDEYSKRWENRFDLFDGDHPFGQHPGLPKDKWNDHWSRLPAARGSFNTNFLYSYDLRDKADNADPTSPREAVLQLMAHQHFALGGLTKRFVTSAKASPFATACLTLVIGGNLRETLCLNLITYNERRNQEKPHWEAEPASLRALERGAVKPVQGLTESYTWAARSILLLPDEDGRITRMTYAEGFNPGDSSYDDPMVCQILNQKGELYALGYREDRGLWRDLHSFVPGKDEKTAPQVVESAARLLEWVERDDQPLDFSSFGIVNNKAKISKVRQETLRLPPLALKTPSLRAKLESWTGQAQEEAYLLGQALREVARGLLSKRRDGASARDVKAQASSLQADALYWPQAETLFWSHLDSLPIDQEEYFKSADTIDERWSEELRRLKVRVYEEATNPLDPTPETLRAVCRGYKTLWKGNAKK